MIKKIVPYLMSVLASLCALLFIIVCVLEYCTYDVKFYNKQYTSYSAAQNIGIAPQDLTKVTKTLTDYLKGKAPSLNIAVSINNNIKQFFNEREKDHMIDVLLLFNFARGVKWVSLVFLVALLCGICFLKRKKSALILSKCYLYTIGAIALIASIIALIVSQNFEKAWNFAHTLVFSNDLWLLDPNTDMLINLVPLEFFIAITSRISILICALLLILTLISICCIILNKCAKKQSSSIGG